MRPHDALSGLPNRVHMVEKIDGFLHGRLFETHNRAVAAISTSTLRMINDTLGHQAAPLIKLVAERLKAACAGTIFSRVSVGMFVILCAPASRGSASLADRVAHAFATPFVVYGQRFAPTASSALRLRRITDGRCLDASAPTSRSMRRRIAAATVQYCFPRSWRNRSSAPHHRIDLRSAIDLCPHYQPVVSSTWLMSEPTKPSFPLQCRGAKSNRWEYTESNGLAQGGVAPERHAASRRH
jgi:GGDEF domain-containing protein